MSNLGVPSPLPNMDSSDTFRCRNCRAEFTVRWDELSGPTFAGHCPVCGYPDDLVRSFVDPSLGDPYTVRADNRRYLFAAAAPGFVRMRPINQADIVYCSGTRLSKCENRYIIDWGQYTEGVLDWLCLSCKQSYRVVMSHEGRMFYRITFPPHLGYGREAPIRWPAVPHWYRPGR